MRERIDDLKIWVRANPTLAAFIAIALVAVVLGGGGGIGYDLHGPYTDY